MAIAAKKWLLERPNYVSFCRFITECGYTAIFEWTSPQARIVLPYQEDELVLLHIRLNETGRYVQYWWLVEIANTFGIKLVDEADDGLELLETISKGNDSLMNTVENKEGWVVQFSNGEMIKIKTKWYLDRHKAMTMLRHRDIAEMVLDECLDDLKSKLVGDGIDISEIEEIENRVVNEIDDIIRVVEDAYVKNRYLPRKEFAILLKEHKFFGLMMQRYTEREPDYKGFYKKHYLSERFDLTRLNFKDSIAEVD